MTDAQRTLELLTSTATEKKIDADNKKDCYFNAHARALKLAIDHKATGINPSSACDDANEDLHTLEYEYPSGDSSSEQHKQTSATNSPLGKD